VLAFRADAAEEAKAAAEREAAAAASKVARHEQQLNELYDLCNTQQGEADAGYMRVLVCCYDTFSPHSMLTLLCRPAASPHG
jgi:hypothetical protein